MAQAKTMTLVLTPTQMDAKRIALCEEKKEDHEANGYWYIWTKNPKSGESGWYCVSISEYNEKRV